MASTADSLIGAGFPNLLVSARYLSAGDDDVDGVRCELWKLR